MAQILIIVLVLLIFQLLWNSLESFSTSGTTAGGLTWKVEEGAKAKEKKERDETSSAWIRVSHVHHGSSFNPKEYAIFRT